MIITQIISSSLSLGYTDNDSVVDAGNDAETYDIGLVLNFAHTTSNQYKESDDDFQSYGFTLGFDTTLGNQSLSPYLIANKSDAQHDADSFSFMYGIGGFFSVGERNSFSYGYSYSDSKANRNSEDNTAHETNTISHSYSLGYDLIITQIISSSLSLGYTDNDLSLIHISEPTRPY